MDDYWKREAYKYAAQRDAQAERAEFWKGWAVLGCTAALGLAANLVAGWI